ncbi:MAG: CBS domain-containing protein [Nitrososphaeria archaeon]|nr:CBS domain-containing protein [Nitrososphaeria archaeon]
MVTLDIGAVIVAGRNGSHGLITEKDVLERAFQVGKDPSRTLARDVMSSPAISVDLGTSLTDMLKMMRDKEIRRLVVTENGKPMGIVTERRILDALI